MSDNADNLTYIWNEPKAETLTEVLAEMMERHTLLKNPFYVTQLKNRIADAHEREKYAWQSMESAPKDGTHIIIAFTAANDYPCAASCYWDAEDLDPGWHFMHNGKLVIGVRMTGWRPSNLGKAKDFDSFGNRL